MIKLAGFVIIMFSTVKIGRDLSEKYINRTNELKNITSGLDLMCKEINFTNSGVADLLYSASKVNNKKIKQLFENMAHLIKNELNTPLLSFNKCKNNAGLALNDADIQILCNYFSTCGKSNAEDEVDSIKNTINMLNYNLESAISDENKHVKLCNFTGVVVGLMISIILL